MSLKVTETKVQDSSQQKADSTPALPTLHIAFIGGHEDEFLMYKQMLSSSKYSSFYQLFYIPDAKDIEELFSMKEIHLFMIDLSTSEDADFKTFRKFHKKHPLIPKVIITDFEDEGVGLKAIRSGAADYLIKEVISSYALNRSIQYAIERNQIERSLWDSNKAMKDFASTAAHDLKSPLATMLTLLDVVQGDQDLPKEELFSVLSKVSRSANRMGRLIEDLLKFAEIENRIITLKKVNLKETINAISEDLNCSENLKYDSLPEIDGDETQVYQLFKNIIENALKFQKPDVKAEIEIYARPMPGFSSFVEIMVNDNGIGIEEANKNKIFKAFTRLSSHYDGTGIGLATCKRIVSNHKGKINIRSKFGEGSTFIITLPNKQF